MIDEIHKKLVCKYTAIITFILIAVFCLCSYLNLQIILNAIDKALFDYLDEEVQEAEENFNKNSAVNQEVTINISPSLTLLSFWFKADKLVYAELPEQDNIRSQMLRIVEETNIPSDTIYKRTINNSLYFRFISRDIMVGNKKIGKVIVVYHATNLHSNFNRFLMIFFGVIVILIILAYFISA